MIERKKKICKGCNTPQYIWARGQCKACSAKSVPKQKDDKVAETSGELELFEQIWAERPHVSIVSGELLDQHALMYFPNLFHHVLPKKNYSRYRLNKDNIVLLTPLEHLRIHSLGRESLLKYHQGFQKVLDMYEELREEYMNNQNQR